MTLDLETFSARYASAAQLDAMASEIAARLPCSVQHVRLENCRDLPLGPATPLVDLCDLPTNVMTKLVQSPPINVRPPTEVLQAMLDANRQHADDPEARRRAKTAILEQADTV